MSYQNTINKIDCSLRSGSMVFNFPMYFTAQKAQRKKAFHYLLMSGQADALAALIERYKQESKAAWDSASRDYQKYYKDPGMEYERAISQGAKKKAALGKKIEAKQTNSFYLNIVKAEKRAFERVTLCETELQEIREKRRF